MQATIYNLAGQEVEKVELDNAIFGIAPNHAVIHQAVLRQQANARQGTHDTKTRADVSGGGKKPWRQKGTGRARQGSTRSPQWRHGGVVFGPHPRSYEQDMPRKMRRLAIRGVLSGKLADGQLLLVDSFDELEPRTKAMAQTLKNLNIGDKKALIFTTGEEATLKLAAGNLPHVKLLSAHLLSIVDMLKHDYVVIPRAALDVVTGILGNTGGRRKLALRGRASTALSTTVATTALAPTDNGHATTDVTVFQPSATALTTSATSTAPDITAEAGIPTEDIVFEPTGMVAEVAAATLSPVETPTETPIETTQAVEVAETPAPAPIAAGTVVIHNVQYKGDEYVEVMNTSDLPIDIGGYKLRDKNDAGQEYTFSEGAALPAGGIIEVYTKPGHDYSFKSKRAIWNDKGDVVELLDAEGKVISTFAYGTYAKDADKNKKSEG